VNIGRDRGRLLQELLVADVLARRGEGPLARKQWSRPRPRAQAPSPPSVRATEPASDAGARGQGAPKKSG
jgi:hypothetical protein